MMDHNTTGFERRNESKDSSALDVHSNPIAEHASSSVRPPVQILDIDQAHSVIDSTSSAQSKQPNLVQTLNTEGEHNAQNAAPSTQPKQPTQSFFGLRTGKAKSQYFLPFGAGIASYIPFVGNAVYPNPDDYESKYPEDNYGEEMGPNARVWRTYLDEARKADAELIEGWRDTTDVLLVFTGLFSAVVATFVVQTSTALQTDYAQITASLLFEQNSLLRATANHTSPDNIPPSPLTPDSNPSVSTNDRWISGLWFTSLSVSLAAAFLALLVKQWMQHYQSLVFGSIQDQVRIRQFRFLGVERWHMPLIISILPILLHIGLLLFFAGLIAFLVPLDAPIAYATVGIAALAYGFYIASNLLPLLYPMCPYKTPLSSLLAAFISSLRALCSILIRRFRMLLLAKTLADTQDNAMAKETNKSGRRALYHMKEAEKGAASRMADELDVESLVWLYSTSSNPTVASVTVQAISGLRFGLPVSIRNILKRVITFGKDSVEDMFIRTALEDKQRGQLADHDRRKAERFLRACHQSGAFLTDGTWQHAERLTSNTNDPKLGILRACHEALTQPTDLYNKPALAYLESGHYGNEKLNPYLWSICLGRCQLGHNQFITVADRWSHGFRIMSNIVSASDISDLQYAMFLEYFCSLSTSRQAENDTDWGEYSLLKGLSYFRGDMVLPQIYRVLSDALCVFRTDHIPYSGLFNKASKVALPKSLMAILIHLKRSPSRSSLDDISPVKRDRIIEAAYALRSEVRNLAESDFFCTDAPDARRALFELAVSEQYWSYDMPAWKIQWTPNMMDYFLWPLEHRSSNDWAFSSFEAGDLDAYRFFEERGGLPKILSYQAAQDLYGHWFSCYLDGLIAIGDPAAREQHINYLFAPEHFPRIVEIFILIKSEDGGTFKAIDDGPGPAVRTPPENFSLAVQGLFQLRPPEQYPDIYGENLDALRQIAADSPSEPSSLFNFSTSELVIQDSVLAESPSVNSTNKPRWRQFFTRCGELLHLSSSRGNTVTKSQNDIDAAERGHHSDIDLTERRRQSNIGAAKRGLQSNLEAGNTG